MQCSSPSAAYPNCQRCYRLVDDPGGKLRINELRGCRQWSIALRDVCPSCSVKEKPIHSPVLTIAEDLVENSDVMKGILWGWLLVLGGVFWASMIGLDYLYLPFINHNSTLPEDVVPIEEILTQSYLSKYLYQVLTVSAVLGIAYYLNRRYFKKDETNIINVKQITANEDLDREASETVTGEEQTNKTSLEVSDDTNFNIDNDEDETEMQESYITPPSVDVRALQARLKEFEDNLALLKEKGERLVTHTEMQRKRWEELNAGDQ